MTAGDFLSGDEPAGQELIPEISAPRGAAPLRALLFLGQARDMPLREDGSGQYRDIHPVDQKVELALLTERGRIASAPDVGLEIADLPRDDGDIFKAEVARRVRTALATLLNAGDIRLLELVARRPFRGAAYFLVRYQNLRDPQSKERELTSSFSPSQ